MVVNAVRRARTERRLSQAGLGELAGVSRQTVSAIESGAVPSVELALRLARALDREVQELFWLPTAGVTPRKALVVAGSDDPGLAALAERLRASGELLLSLSPVGSGAGLQSVAAGASDLAGVHLGDNLVRSRAALGDAALLQFARREQGLALRPERAVRALEDIEGLRLVVRQHGSGTRELFDRLVAERLAPRIAAEASTHDQVAAAILRGEADAGTTIRAIARRYGLGFFPLAWERFDLAFRAALLEDSRVTALRAALADRSHRRAIEALGGYDLAEAGEVVRG